MTDLQEQKKARRVLLVDDDPVSLRYFTACLPKAEYHCVTCASVVEVQALMGKQGTSTFDCVVTDYHMPGQNGVDLLKWLSQVDATLASIVITSGGQKSMLEQTIRVGAVDFLEKPVSREIFIQSIDKTCEITDQRRELNASHQALQNLANVRDIFLNFEGSGEKIATSSNDILFFPKSELGGDFVDFFEISTSKKLILCGDVSGHDLKAAYVSAYFQGMISGLMHTGCPIEESIRFFNEILINRLNKHNEISCAQAFFSISAACFLVDEKENFLQVMNCGLPMPYYMDKDGVMRVCQKSSQPLGWFDDLELESEKVELSQIQRLYVYTDGLPDMADALGVNLFSLAFRLFTERDILKRKQLVQDSLDDIFMMALRLREMEKEEDEFHPILVQELKGGTQDCIDQYQSEWEKSIVFATANVPLGERLMDVLLCCRETALNGLTHGCKDKPESFCHLQLCLNVSRNVLRLRVDDPGDGFDFDINTRIVNLDKLEQYHFGLVMIQSMSDKMEFQRNGATIILEFNMNEENYDRALFG